MTPLCVCLIFKNVVCLACLNVSSVIFNYICNRILLLSETVEVVCEVTFFPASRLTLTDVMIKQIHSIKAANLLSF